MTNITPPLAWRKGYRDGYMREAANCPATYNDAERHEYRTGYDAGVADYCDETYFAA